MAPFLWDVRLHEWFFKHALVRETCEMIEQKVMPGGIGLSALL